MAVSKEELIRPSFSGDLKGLKAERRFKIPMGQEFAFMEEILGLFTVAGNVIQATGLYTYPGKPFLTLESYRIEPFHDRVTGVDSNGVATDSASDAFCVATLVYGTKPYDEDDEDPNNPGAYISHRINGSHQTLEHSNAGLKWENNDAASQDTLPEDVRPGVPVTIVEHEIIWHHVVNPPFTRLYGLSGKVNSSSFLGHAAEQVLLESFSASRELIPGTRTKWELSIHLKARVVPDNSSVGWNHFLQPNPSGGNKWVRIVYRTGGAKLLPTANFDTLFQLS